MASEDQISEVISSFMCSHDMDIELFLKEKAIRYEKKSKSRTYILFGKNDDLEEVHLLAYFTLAMQTLKIPNGTSNSKVRQLDGIYSKRGDQQIEEVPVYLIGQLSKNDKHRNEISGKQILEYALAIIDEAQSMIGGRVILAECQDKAVLTEFYYNNGFKVFRQDPDDQLIQMIRVFDSGS